MRGQVAVRSFRTMAAKRKAEASLTSPSKKTHPFFAVGGPPKPLGNFLSSPSTLIHFLHLDPFAASSSDDPVLTTATSSDGTSSPKGKAKASPVRIAFYDLDGTLIKPRSGNKFPSKRDDWMWWSPSVPAKLKEEWDSGRHLVVISNQADSREKIRSEWRAKLSLIATKMPPGVPIRILAALSKFDVYRKPNVGMFDTVKSVYADRGLDIDLAGSVFVGDAAGRAAAKGRAKDHSDTDFKFALNVGIPFMTPEAYFLGEDGGTYPDPPIGFKPSHLGNLAALPHILPSNSPIVRSQKEIVLFVGPPAAGKSTFYRRHFAPHQYEHINQDILHTRERCMKVAEEHLSEGRSVIIDNTNRNRDTRAVWVQMARRLGVSIRVFHFVCPIELARHNNVYRACYAPLDEPAREMLPGTAFWSYQSTFEPIDKDEGFGEIRTVNFVFDGTDEQRRKWDMYMLEVK